MVGIYIGVGFCIARSDDKGNAKASSCGASNGMDSHAFFIYVFITKTCVRLRVAADVNNKIMKFRPNGSSRSYNVSSIEDIISLMGHHLDGFSNIHIDRNMVLANPDNDPTFICIGYIEG